MNQKKYWFVAVVTPNTEKSCQKKLDAFINDLNKTKKTTEGADMECENNMTMSYVPTRRELHEWPSRGKRVWVDRVICPSYLFIRSTDRERYQMACQAKFILHFLMDRATKDENGRSDFARIPAYQMEQFMLMVSETNNNVSIEPASLQVGDKVRIKVGRLKGLEGFIFKEPNANTTRLAFGIDFLGYATMECPIEIMEKVNDK